MIDKVAIIVSPNWRDYAKKYLADCVESLRKQNFTGSFKIFMSDNESSPESVNFIRSIAPEIKIIQNADNAGFCKGNNVAIREAINEGFEYFALVNMDTVLAENWLSELMRAAEFSTDWGAIQQRLMLFSQKDKINSLGNSLHYLGFGFSAGGSQKWDEALLGNSVVVPITYPSGAAVLLKKEALDKVGMFDEEFWMYHDDLDLGWRMRLGGYQIYLAPKSVVYHKYEFSKSMQQYYWMERNRFIFLFSSLESKTLILISPMLLVFEFGLLLFSIRGGFLKEKFKVYHWLLQGKNWNYIRARKVMIARFRILSDRELAGYLSCEINFQEVNNFVLQKIANPILRGYWSLIRRFI